jgi:transcriptional regulator with XRE-family HTH domain
MQAAKEVTKLLPVDSLLRQASMLTPEQLRAARALVGWSRNELAAKSSVSSETVKRFEFRGSDPKLSTLNKWRRALEIAGVEFIDEGSRSEDGGPGVRFRKTKAKR